MPCEEPVFQPVSNSEREFYHYDDELSRKAIFCWEIVAGVGFPCLLRNGGKIKCISVRMVESKLLKRFPKFRASEMFGCAVLSSSTLTTAEADLLESINKTHCDNIFGTRKFTTKEAVVRLNDFRLFYDFVNKCYKKLKGIALSCGEENRCGFLRLNGESVLAYVEKDGGKYVPLFYFEGDVENLCEKSVDISGWELAYLKFCCKVQGISNGIFESSVCRVVSFEVIKSIFPKNCNFEEYWPTRRSSTNAVNQKTRSQVSWIRNQSAPVVRAQSATGRRNPISNQNGACFYPNDTSQFIIQREINGRPKNIEDFNAQPLCGTRKRRLAVREPTGPIIDSIDLTEEDSAIVKNARILTAYD